MAPKIWRVYLYVYNKNRINTGIRVEVALKILKRKEKKRKKDQNSNHAMQIFHRKTRKKRLVRFLRFVESSPYAGCHAVPNECICTSKRQTEETQHVNDLPRPSSLEEWPWQKQRKERSMQLSHPVAHSVKTH